ncbi:MAG: hypothetical protein K2P81_12130 [Bacteriovoracaceae bacterium]|nr:hypothetical protein [Bacteriovoracaceae bacterium]
MQDRRLTVSVDLPLAALALAVIALHLFTLLAHFNWQKPLEEIKEYHDHTFKIKDLRTIRTVGEKNSKLKDRVLISKTKAEKAQNDFFQPVTDKQVKALPKKFPPVTQKQASQTNPYKPSMRPKALDQLMMRQEPVKQVAARTQSGGASSLAGSPTLSKSLMNMQVEVPEGVAMDELNEFELMFYGFQKRMMEKYVNSIMLNVRDYEKKYSLQMLMPEGKHVMTGRVTFDSDGNIKQIKMLRWTQADKLQAMFEDILKSMLTLPNPPKILRNRDGEFVVFYTFTVNNT